MQHPYKRRGCQLCHRSLASSRHGRYIAALAAARRRGRPHKPVDRGSQVAEALTSGHDRISLDMSLYATRSYVRRGLTTASSAERRGRPVGTPASALPGLLGDHR